MDNLGHNDRPLPQIDSFDPDIEGQSLGDIELQADRWLRVNKNRLDLAKEEEHEIERVEVIADGVREAIAIAGSIGQNIHNARFDESLPEEVRGIARFSNHSIRLNANLIPRSGYQLESGNEIDLLSTVSLHEAGHLELDGLDTDHRSRSIDAIEGANHLVTEQRSAASRQFGIYREEVNKAKANLSLAGESEIALKEALDKKDQAEIVRLMDVIEGKDEQTSLAA